MSHSLTCQINNYKYRFFNCWEIHILYMPKLIAISTFFYCWGFLIPYLGTFLLINYVLFVSIFVIKNIWYLIFCGLFLSFWVGRSSCLHNGLVEFFNNVIAVSCYFCLIHEYVRLWNLCTDFIIRDLLFKNYIAWWQFTSV